ncbi:MAG: DUF1800 family protein [Betaproteobacteria bacterium]|nr:DUF1800 family protein [Betaproteobacteria bacterium]
MPAGSPAAAFRVSRRVVLKTAGAAGTLFTAACAGPGGAPSGSDARPAIAYPPAQTASGPAWPALAHSPADIPAWLDRLSWGCTPSLLASQVSLGPGRWLAGQLRPEPGHGLPPELAASLPAPPPDRDGLSALLIALERSRRAAEAERDDARQRAARQAYQQELAQWSQQAQARSILLAVHSRHQLRELMTWFWFNHFNINQYKANLRALVGDYEERAIRAHALGRFRDLLGAAVRHPAMLRYLDNEQNAAGRLNENLARELLELHTLGVDAGYRQTDVQELARVLTGVGVNFTDDAPRLRPGLQPLYRREGLFEFNPNRHDGGDKQLLGRRIRGRGLEEFDEVLDLLAAHPATARFVCGKLARYLVADPAPPALVARAAERFLERDGDIAAVLALLIGSPEFQGSLGRLFKTPAHFVFSGLRLAAEAQPQRDPASAVGWLARLGQPLFSRPTPDGYPLAASAWNSPGQLTARFDIARALGSTPHALALPRPPGPATQAALARAGSIAERNFLVLASPEFMVR